MRPKAVILTIGAAALTWLALAQDPQMDPGAVPPPSQDAALGSADQDGPGVPGARISVMSGEVSVRRGDSGDLIAAALNAPLVVTDRVLTGLNSRAEIQFDSSNMIRIGYSTEVRLSGLEYKHIQV